MYKQDSRKSAIAGERQAQFAANQSRLSLLRTCKELLRRQGKGLDRGDFHAPA